eukprot:1162059-Pelagomonas_calceolata.AAC.7
MAMVTAVSWFQWIGDWQVPWEGGCGPTASLSVCYRLFGRRPRVVGLMLCPADEAAAEVRSNGLASCVTIRHRDVEGCGFPCGQGQTGEGEQGKGSCATIGMDGDGLRMDGTRSEADGGSTCGGDKEVGKGEGCGRVQDGGSEIQQQGGAGKEDGSDAGRDDELNLAGKADAVFLDLPAPPKNQKMPVFRGTQKVESGPYGSTGEQAAALEEHIKLTKYGAQQIHNWRARAT